MNVQHIKLNIIPGGVLPVVHVSQYDHNAGGLVFDIYNGGEVYELPEGMTASIEGTKPDEYGFLYPAAAVSGHSVTIDIMEQMTVVPGKVICELRLAHQQDNVGTINFILAVEPAGLSDDTEVSETDIPLLREAIEAGQQAIQSAAQAEISADRAEEEADRAEQAADDLISVKTTAAAAIITVDDAKAAPLLQFKGVLEPTQSGSGDPSPDNVRPISGYTGLTVTRAGKNLLPNTGAATTTSAGVTYTKHSDGSVTASGTATGTSTYRFVTAADRFTLKAGTYRISGITPSSDISITWRATDGTSSFWYDADNEFTLTADKTYEFIALRFQSGAVVSNVTVYPMIRPASVADATYEPYNGATYALTFPVEAGTVYGGTLTVNSDGSGTLTVTTEKRTLNGDTSWGGVSTDSVSGITRAYSGASYGDIDIIACDSLMVDNAYTAVNHIGKQSAGTRYFITPSYIQGLTSVAEVKAALTEHPIEAVFTLATPTTYALSAAQVAQMLQGDNNIWMDAAGTVQILYTTQSALSDIQQNIVDLQADVTDLQTEIVSAVKKSDIVQTGTVTTAGQYVVDARQLNPSISGTIAKRITDLETAAADDLNTGDITRATNITATGTKVVDAYELNASKAGTLARKISDAATAASAAQTTANTANTAAGNANTALGGFSFGFTADNKPGYKQPGADTVVPFSTGGVEVIAEVANVTAGTSTPVTLATGVDLSKYQFIGLLGVTNTNQHGDCVFTLNVGNSLQVSRQIGWYMENDMSDPRVAGNRYSMFFSVNSSETNATITIQAVDKIGAYQVFAQSIILYGIK